MNIKILLTLVLLAIHSTVAFGQQEAEIAWQKKLSQTLAIENSEQAMKEILAEEERLKKLKDTFSQRCLAELLIRAKLPRAQGMAKATIAKQAIGHLDAVLQKEPENVLALYLHGRTCAGLPPIFGTAPAATSSFQTLFEIEKRKPGSVPYPDAFVALTKIRQKQLEEVLNVGRRTFPDNQELRALHESRKVKKTKGKRPASDSTEKKRVSQNEHESKKAFKDALLEGKMDFGQLDRKLAAEELLYPKDFEYPLFRGLLRLWQLEVVLDAEIVTQAETHLRRAIKLNPEDTRIYGWLGPLLFVAGHKVGNKKMIKEGQQLLDEGVRLNPEQNLFSRAFAYNATGAHGKLVEADLYRTMQLCTGQTLDRSRFLPGEQTNDHCSCGDSPSAPYNLSGTYYWAGEVFRRSGDMRRAKDGYENALRKDVNKSWPFRALTEERLKLLDNNKLAAKPNPVSCMLCHQSNQVQSDSQLLEQKFQQKFDALFQQNKDAVGAIVHIEFPEKNISWTSAVGFSDKEKTSPLDKEQPVLIASNTKTYVAASILRLVEMGRLELDRSLRKSLSTESNRLLEKAGYDTEKLTVKHLLSHTSGIQDYVDDAYFERVKKAPRHQWKKQDQILLSMSKGPPLFEAGEKFSYGDINYLFLTEIIEQETKQAFYVSMRELLKFDELNIKHTWFKNLEPTPVTDSKCRFDLGQVTKAEIFKSVTAPRFPSLAARFDCQMLGPVVRLVSIHER